MNEMATEKRDHDYIRAKIVFGVNAREAGDFEQGRQVLEEAFGLAINNHERDLAIEAGNNLSIQYRLIAGRSGRDGNLVNAEAFSTKSLQVYSELDRQGFVDEQDTSILRNRSHALLYAGYVDEAIPALQKSAETQTNPAAKGDEYCHLASAYITVGDLAKAEELINQGLALIRENDGSLIWLTHGLMAQATLLVRKGATDEVKETLKQASDIAERNNLAVRKEEINFLQNKKSEDVNVLEAVSGNLKEVRQLSKEIMESMQFPNSLPEHPMVLMIGGFQGSGKTTIIEEIKDDLGLVVISGDEIRQRLFDKKYPFSKRFGQIVEATAGNVFRDILHQGRSMALDTNTTPTKIEQARRVVESEGGNKYHLITVLLEASKDTLVNRLQNRDGIAGRYRGTVDELEASLVKHGEIDKGAYDLVVDTTSLSPSDIAEMIKDKVKSIQEP